ncbi:MAG: TrmH family RNA methyltransferase [Bacteroidales bacterium]|nr:TrmH family RNA methyltransferase [Bacteroidales bacterium]
MSELNIQANNFFNSIDSIPSVNFPPIIVADNFRTPENIGSIIRLAGSIGCKEVFVTDTNKNEIRISKIKKTATTAFNSVKLTFITTNELLSSKIPSNYTSVAIETAPNAENIFTTNLPNKIIFFFGNEAFGVSKQILDFCQKTVYIPLPGDVKSLNVTHAAAISLFEWYRKTIIR